MAQLTPEQAAAKLKLKARAAESAKETPDLSWWDKFKNEASGMGEGMLHIAQRPLDLPAMMVDTAAGGLEAGARYMYPEGAATMDELNNFIARLTGNTLTEPTTVGKNSPQAEFATNMAKDTYQSFKHPVDSFSERPISTVLDWGGALGGLIGKVPGVVKKAGAVRSADEILAASKKAKDDAFTAAYNYPGEINTGSLRDAALRAADEAGYHPDRILSEPNRVAVTDISRNYPNTGSVRDVHQMRQTADVVDARPTVKAPGLGADNPIAEAMKDAIDSGLEQSNPEAFALLKKAFDLNTRYKNTQTILDVRNKGELAGTLSPNAAKTIGTEVRKAVSDKGTVRGLGSETAADLSHVMDLVKPASTLGRIRDELISNLPIAAGGVGFLTGMGPAGALLGGAAGTGIKHFLANARNAKTARAMSEELLAIASDLNNLPRGEAIKKLGMMKLTPEKRAALAATLGISLDPQQTPSSR